MSLDPDNESHTVTLSGQFAQKGAVVSGRLFAGQMTQDEPLSPRVTAINCRRNPWMAKSISWG